MENRKLTREILHELVHNYTMSEIANLVPLFPPEDQEIIRIAGSLDVTRRHLKEFPINRKESFDEDIKFILNGKIEEYQKLIDEYFNDKIQNP